MIKYLVFDFDGTIADTFHVFKEIGEEIAERYALKMNVEEARDLGFKKALLKSRFPMWQIPQTIKEIRHRMAESIANEAEPIKGIIPALTILSQKFHLGILSSNSKENIGKFLIRHKIKGLFEFIYSDSSVFGKHIIIAKLCKKYSINADEIIFIGDEDRDIMASNKMKMKSIAVSWGFNNVSALQKAKPTYMISRPKELLTLF